MDRIEISLSEKKKVIIQGAILSIMVEDTVTESVNILHTRYYAVFRCAFGKKRIMLGNSDEQISIKVRKKDAQIIQEYVETNSPECMSANMSAVAKHLCFNEYLWVYNDEIIYLKRKSFIRNKFDLNFVKVSDVAFFNESGVVNKKIYFGYLDQIEIKSPGKGVATQLKTFIMNNGGKIGKQTQQNYKSSFRLSKIYNPSYWFTKETISFNEEAMIYHQKTFFTQDSMYIPYDKMVIVLASKGYFRKRIIVLGEMHMLTKQPFSKSVANEIVKHIAGHGVSATMSGQSFGPSKLWFRWLHTWYKPDAKIIVDETRLFIQPGQMGGMFTSVGGLSAKVEDCSSYEEQRIKKIGVVQKSAIKSANFAKNHWWNLFGVLNITFSAESIRKDQKDIQASGCIAILHMRKSDANRLIYSLDIPN